jgi:hypothetical protein
LGKGVTVTTKSNLVPKHIPCNGDKLKNPSKGLRTMQVLDDPGAKAKEAISIFFFGAVQHTIIVDLPQIEARSLSGRSRQQLNSEPMIEN